MKVAHMVAFVLTVVGGLNWGLVGAMDFNLVEKLLGEGGLANAVYVLVGLSAVLLVVSHRKDCRHCEAKTGAPAM